MSDLPIFKTFLHHLLIDYIDANYESALSWLKLLRKMQIENNNLFDGLDTYDQARLKLMAKALDDGAYINILTEYKSPIYGQIKIEKTNVKYEKDIQKVFLKNQECFQQLFGKDFRFTDTLFQTNYGIVDLVAQKGLVVFPVEIKLNQATHAVVGQIIKYIKCFMYKLNYNFWREVTGIVIAQSFGLNVLDELKKLNVISIQYSYANTTLTLRRV